MKLIKCLAAQMVDECNGSIEYSKCALEYQVQYPKLARLYHELSAVELQHAKSLHEQAEIIINELKASGKTIPANMKHKYQEKHECYIELLEEAQLYFSLF